MFIKCSRESNSFVPGVSFRYFLTPLENLKEVFTNRADQFCEMFFGIFSYFERWWNRILELLTSFSFGYVFGLRDGIA